MSEGYRIATEKDWKNGVSYSRISTYQLCRAKGGWKYEEREKDQAMGVPGVFSSVLVHLPIAAWYRNHGNHVPEWGELWDTFLEPFGGLPPESPYILECAKAIFELYTKTFVDDFEHYKILYVETLLARDIPHTNTTFICKPDLVLKRFSDDSIWTKDFKARKYSWPSEVFDDQMISQAWTLGAMGHIKQELIFGVQYKTGKPFAKLTAMVPEVMESVRTEAWLRDYKAIILELETVGHRAKNPSNCRAFKVLCQYHQHCLNGESPKVTLKGA